MKFCLFCKESYMKYLSVFLLSLFISFNVHADEYIEKPFSLGFGL